MSVGSCRDQKEMSDLLELELKAVIRYPTWILGTKLEPSGRARRSLNH